MIRISVVALLLAWGAWKGGVYGMIAVGIFIVPILLWIFGKPDPAAQEARRDERELFSAEEVTGARKGHRDPTRPTEDDYAAMITDNYGKRRR